MSIQKAEIADFAKYFKDFSDCYSIIGGTATLIYLEERNPGQHNKATKDLDIVVLDLSEDQKQSRFLDQFKRYVEEMAYTAFQRQDGSVRAYRFINPTNGLAPRQIEISTRRQDGIPLDRTTQRLEDFDMSAIVCEPEYLEFVRDHSELKPVLGETSEPVPISKVIPIIMMKALAYLNLENRSKLDAGRHVADILRLSGVLQEGDQIKVPAKIHDPYLKLKARADTVFNAERIRELLGNGITAEMVISEIDRFVTPQ